MKVIKQIFFVLCYFLAMFVTASLLELKNIEDTMRIFGMFIFICTVVFVVWTEIYHHHKDSIRPLITLAMIFIINMICMSYLYSDVVLIALASIMFAIIFVRNIFNTKIEFLGCYNLWLFSSFTIVLYFILIFNGSILLVLALLIILLMLAKLKFSNDVEYQRVCYIQNIVGLVLIMFIMLFL